MNWVAPEKTMIDEIIVSSGPISGRAAAPYRTPKTAIAAAAGAAMATMRRTDGGAGSGMTRTLANQVSGRRPPGSLR